MKMKINLKKAIGAAIALAATWQLGEMFGAYKMLKGIDAEEGQWESARVKGLRSGIKDVEDLMAEVKGFFRPKTEVKEEETEDPAEEQDEEIFCEEAEETEESATEEVETDQPED